MTDAIKVLTKGTLATSKHDNFAAVKNYLIVAEGDRRYLLLKLVNNRAEKITGVTVSVEQYNYGNERISIDDFELDVLGYPAKTFAVEQKLPVSDNCADCRISVKSVSCDGFVYASDELDMPAYKFKPVRESGTKIVDDKAQSKRKDGAVVVRHSLKMPVLIAVIALIALGIASIALAMFMGIFRTTSTEFMNFGVMYEFADDDRSDNSDVYVTGIYGDNVRAVIPVKIAGHRVAGVRDNAFDGKQWLKSVSIAGDIPIGASAFKNCASLSSVEMNKATEIGDNAFEGCVSLTSIKLDGARRIGARAFYGCGALDSVTVAAAIGKTIDIGENAFGGCSALKTISIGKKIDFGNSGARVIFDGSLDAALLHIAEFDSKASGGGLGLLFSKNQDGGISKISRLEIEMLDRIGADFLRGISVDSISVDTLVDPRLGDDAFNGCSSLVYAKLDMLSEIGARAFRGTAITELDGTNLQRIGVGAFENCTKLTRVALENNLVLENIPDSAFKGCSSLVGISLPAELIGLGANAFYGCTALEKVNFVDGGKIAEINGSAFFGCSALSSINIPSSVTTVGESAFEGCTKLENLVFPTRLATIGRRAFFGSGLRAVVLAADVASIGMGAFGACEKLTSATLPFLGNSANGKGLIGSIFDAVQNSVSANGSLPASLDTVKLLSGATVNKSAFEGCVWLKNIDLSSAAPTAIGTRAFYGCERLNSLALGDSVVKIGDYAFYGCALLASLVIPSSVGTVGDDGIAGTIGKQVLEGCAALEDLTIPFVGPSSSEPAGIGYLFGTDEIGAEQDAPQKPKKNALKKVTITAATELGAEAFYDCTSLRVVNIASNLTKIGERAFYNCRKLNSFTLPQTVTLIEKDAFSQCYLLYEIHNNSELYIEAGADTHGKIARYALKVFGAAETGMSLKKVKHNGFEFAESENKWYLVGYDSVADVRLPSAFVGDGDAKVTDYAVYGSLFYDDKEIKTLVVSDAVTAVGDEAFMDCINLESVNFAPNVESVGDGVFYGCKKLVKATLPDGLTAIGNRMFGGCVALKTIDMPSNCASIGNDAFKNCAKLGTIAISSCTSIGDSAFEGCTKLRDVDTSGVTSMGANAFKNCASIKRIVLCEDLASLGADAFSGCIKLMEMYILTTQVGANVLNSAGCYNAAKVFRNMSDALPQQIVNNSLHYYKLDGGWTLVDYFGEDENADVVANAFTYNSASENVTSESVASFSVRSYAFYDVKAKSLVSNAVTSIDEYAFIGATIGEIDISSGSLTVATSAFYGCEVGAISVVSTGKVTLVGQIFESAGEDYPNKVGSLSIVVGTELVVPRMAFSSGVGSFSADVTGNIIVESNAFSGSGVQAVSITATGSVRIIENAFTYAGESVAVEISGGAVEIGRSAFGSSGATGVAINSLGTVNIADGAFSGAGAMETVSVAGGGDVTLGNAAFSGNVALSAFVVSSDEKLTVGDGVMQYCAELADISLSGNTIIVGSNIIANNEKVKKFVIVGNDITIGQNMLYGCYSGELKITVKAQGGSGTVKVDAGGLAGAPRGIDGIDVSAKNVSFGAGAFAGSRMNGVAVRATVGVVFADRSFTSAVFDVLTVETQTLNLPPEAKYSSSNGVSCLNFLKSLSLTYANGILSVDMFKSLYMLEYVKLDGSETQIPAALFRDCGKLKEAVLPSRITEIGDEAFYGCSSLSSITIPSGVTKIGARAFASCGNLAILKFPSSLEAVGDSAFYGSGLSEVTLPEGLSRIGKYSFNACESMEKLVLPSTLVEIPDNAFGGCYMLGDLQFSEGLATIGVGAFSSCRTLSAIRLPSTVKEIKQNAFSWCGNATEIIIPNGVTALGGSAFSECYALKKLTLPATLTEIPERAFDGCRALVELTILGGTSIGRGAFYECRSLTTLTLPSTLASIGSEAFYNCTKLASLVIPDSVTTIEYNAFGVAMS